MPGTPLEEQPPVDIFELVRLIATTRIALPQRQGPPQRRPHAPHREGQALCFFAGANSIFYGDKLLTAANPGKDDDRALLHELDLKPQAPFISEHPAGTEHECGSPMACLT